MVVLLVVLVLVLVLGEASFSSREFWRGLACHKTFLLSPGGSVRKNCDASTSALLCCPFAIVLLLAREGVLLSKTRGGRTLQHKNAASPDYLKGCVAARRGAPQLGAAGVVEDGVYNSLARGAGRPASLEFPCACVTFRHPRPVCDCVAVLPPLPPASS